MNGGVFMAADKVFPVALTHAGFNIIKYEVGDDCVTPFERIPSCREAFPNIASCVGGPWTW